MLPLAHMAYGSNAKMLVFRQLTGQLLSKSSEKKIIKTVFVKRRVFLKNLIKPKEQER
jgi:hypothetical protein